MYKLFVGNLSFSATEDSVRALFTQYGTVESVVILTDRDTGQPRGFGFVEMSDSSAGRKAIAGLNDTDSKAAQSKSVKLVRGRIVAVARGVLDSNRY